MALHASAQPKAARVLYWLLPLVAGCGPLDGPEPAGLEPVRPVGVERPSGSQDWPVRGGWFAPRGSVPLGDPQSVDALTAMGDLGLDHAAIGVDVTMPDMAEPELEWGAPDPEVARAIAQVRAAGLLPVLVPRIESPAFFQPPYPFRADIAFVSPGQWQRFFTELGDMLVHYAQFCEVNGVVGMGLGLEMLQAVQPEHDAAWRRVIARVREHFSGWLTYSANWYQEYEQVTFWDALDAIGIGAYFEAVPDDRAAAADAAEIALGWEQVMARLARFSQRHGRPILFTEVGFPGYAHGPARPWKWAGVSADTPVDWGRQAVAYAGMLRAARGRPWLRGFLLWRFHTTTEGVAPWEYAVQGRPAEGVIRRALAGNSR